MHVLVTAGNTLVPIDQVRCITNVFTGRTGTRIALHAEERGHTVTLATSHPEIVAEMQGSRPPVNWSVQRYRTFEDLQALMETGIRRPGLDVVIHCAAVSDYRVAGVYGPAAATQFHAEDGRWEASRAEPPRLLDRSAGKVKSDEPELWLRLVRTPKLIDRVRSDWGFHGLLVKFKLEVGLTLQQFQDIAERSRRQSTADLMVANTLEGSREWALLGPLEGKYLHVDRPDLAAKLLDALEKLHEERGHG
jgi:phosphopantothenoylcysteine synthetase/decarboxylase